MKLVLEFKILIRWLMKYDFDVFAYIFLLSFFCVPDTENSKPTTHPWSTPLIPYKAPAAVVGDYLSTNVLGDEHNCETGLQL